MTDSTLISRAAEFAARAHAGQTRHGSDTPYYSHVELAAAFGPNVADLVTELTNDDEQKHRMGKEAYMVQKLSRLTP